MNKKTGLELLREPFPENQISKLPKGTKAQNECPVNEKINCKLCGGWHHPKVIHLDYVGHAALTDRLLDADPLWTWEPFALKDGLPAFDMTGGLWIRLTVCGMSRIGYGNAAAVGFRTVGDREKEVIGDALRNAAMRFGAALDLWHKGDLHIEDDTMIGNDKKEAKKAISEDEKPIPSTAPIIPPVSPEPPQMLLPGSSLHKKIEAKIGEAGIDRELFKEWLASVGWVKMMGDKLSLKTLSRKNALYLHDKWESARKTFGLWVDKRPENVVSNTSIPTTSYCPQPCPNREGTYMLKSYCDSICESREGCPAWG